MKHLNLLLLIFSISTTFCSCTVTKRHFGNGYHVEWKRKMKESNSQKELVKLQPPENDVVFENKSDTSSLVSSEVIETQNESTIDDIQVQQSEKILEAEPNPQSIESQTIQKLLKSDQKKPENEELPKRRMHPLTWAIWGAWSIGIVFIFFVTFYPEALIGVAVFFLLAMIFSFFIIHSLRKHPEKYRLKKLTYGFVIPAIIFGGIVLAGLGLFLLMSLA